MNGYVMDRESLKRHCEAMCKRFENVPTSGTYQEHKLVLDLLNQTEWIPVSERLPESAFGCFVTVEEDDRYGEPQRVLYPEFVGYDGETWNNAEGKAIPFDVIAWMPLPESYKEGDRE